MKATFVKGEGCLDAIESWERLIADYEDQTMDMINEAIKANILIMDQDDADLKHHLQLNASRLTNYTLVRAEIQLVVSNSRGWSSKDAVPMLVDALGWPKGKGKRDKHKSKGKDKSKG